MTLRVDYEWVVEPIDVNEEIIECHYFDEHERSRAARFAFDLAKDAEDNVLRIDFGLCRHTWHEIDGEIERTYAYADFDGKLPAKFEDGHDVPQRFMK